MATRQSENRRSTEELLESIVAVDYESAKNCRRVAIKDLRHGRKRDPTIYHHTLSAQLFLARIRIFALVQHPLVRINSS